MELLADSQLNKKTSIKCIDNYQYIYCFVTAVPELNFRTFCNLLTITAYIKIDYFVLAHIIVFNKKKSQWHQLR